VIARPGILTNPTAIYVGNISFSFYLLHFAVLMNMRSIMPAHKLLSVALALLVTILLSSVSYFFIEVPMRKLIRQVAGRRTVDYALS
jgi:peptidoglycan/LPS O-acetylase OafA/YrhL